MTEFTQKLLHYCRNPKCGAKMPTQAENKREAFCGFGCYRGFYWTRCVVCEEPMKRTREDQRCCRKRLCRLALARHQGLGCYYDRLARRSMSKTPGFIDSKPHRFDHKPWHIVAGPKITASQFHCATVPDGPKSGWAGGAYERTTHE